MKCGLRGNRIVLITLLFTAVLLACAALTEAQYQTEVITEITIDDSGSFIAIESSVGVTYFITGTPGSTGSVTTQIYNGNPQPNAIIPTDTTLTKFIVVTFDFDPEDFTQATLTFSYTNADVANIEPPYGIFKYNPEDDLFVQLEATVDASAKTITITLDSRNDPLFAIGGKTVATEPIGSSTIWIALAVAVIIIVIVVFLVVKRYSQ